MHITVYHAYAALHTTASTTQARLLYHIQARIRSTVYAAPHTQAPEHGRAMPDKASKKCGYRAHLYALYMVGFSHSAQKNRLHNG